MIETGILAVLMAGAVLFDLRVQRIPNWLVASAALAGLGASALPGGTGPGGSLGGLATGLVLFLPLYAFRAMGAGDVKLMAAAGTCLGAAATFAAAIYAVALGGGLAVLYALRRGALVRLFTNLRLFAYTSAMHVAAGAVPSVQDLPLTRIRAPYSLAIAGGVLVQLLLSK